MRQSYGRLVGRTWQPLGDRSVVGLAAAASVAAWRADLGVTAIVAVWAVLVAWHDRSRHVVPVALVVVVVAVAGVRGAQAWAGLAPDAVGPFRGWARVVDDPQPFPSATRVVVEIEHERFEYWARGRAARLRAMSWRGGDMVAVAGERIGLRPDRIGRVAWQHVVGELRLDWAGDVAPGGPVARASNRVRAAIERGAAQLPADDAALFRGLVVGDDREQPPEMLQRFRASGLSHLTAVSGQNVSYVLAAAGPLLRLLRPWSRWAVTVALIGWFVVLTRFEPSIVRAGTMAAISATAFVRGRERAPLRVLCLAVAALALVDPLIVRSVGFWLSVGATAGVCAVGPWLAARLPVHPRLAVPLGITLGAQVGVVIPSVLVFGRLPLVSVPANLLAVPVAGVVMLYGLPAGLVAGLVPALAPIAMAPARIGVRWVDTVAVVAARLEPPGAWSWIGWALVVAAVAAAAGKNRGSHVRAAPHR